MISRKLTAEEVAKLRLLPFGKKHAIRIMIEKLQPGENLQVIREDFTWKRQTPMRFCREIARSKGSRFEISKMEPFIGWVVTRLA